MRKSYQYEKMLPTLSQSAWLNGMAKTHKLASPDIITTEKIKISTNYSTNWDLHVQCSWRYYWIVETHNNLVFALIENGKEVLKETLLKLVTVCEKQLFVDRCSWWMCIPSHQYSIKNELKKKKKKRWELDFSFCLLFSLKVCMWLLIMAIWKQPIFNWQRIFKESQTAESEKKHSMWLLNWKKTVIFKYWHSM